MRYHHSAECRPLPHPREAWVYAWAIVLVLSAAFGLRALAGEGGPPPVDRAAYAEKKFQELDRNGDGKLDQTELNKPELFAKMDKDGDGFITLEEMKASAAGPGGGAQPPVDPAAYAEKKFQELDKNGDGQLDQTELNKPELFAKMDKDGNGSISLEEMKAYFIAQHGGAKPLGGQAGNAAGGAIDPAAREKQIEATFAHMDRNADGKLEAQELLDPQTLKRLDGNADGFVTLEEAKAVLLAPLPAPTKPPAGQVGPDQSFAPLTALGAGQYQGFEGGLYPGGGNVPPPAYLEQGRTAARAIQPLNATGQPDPNGRIVLLSIGMSNATQEFSVFKAQADADPAKNPQLTIVDGAQGGQTASVIRNPGAPFWGVVDQRLEAAGVTSQQVQVVWLKEANAVPTLAFPADAQALKQDLAAVVQVLATRYPNLKIIYVSSRTYGGWATTRLNPEPFAYQSGFAVKWLIQERIEGNAPGPWVAWGPYLWTDGTRGRADGLVWNREDTGPDGTHPSPSGRAKVAQLLLQFFKSDETARGWFVRYTGVAPAA